MKNDLHFNDPRVQVCHSFNLDRSWAGFSKRFFVWFFFQDFFFFFFLMFDFPALKRIKFLARPSLVGAKEFANYGSDKASPIYFLFRKKAQNPEATHRVVDTGGVSHLMNVLHPRGSRSLLPEAWEAPRDDGFPGQKFPDHFTSNDSISLGL